MKLGEVGERVGKLVGMVEMEKTWFMNSEGKPGTGLLVLGSVHQGLWRSLS